MRLRKPKLYIPGHHCRECRRLLTAEERHYYKAADGTAMCNDCERKWSEDVAKWRRGEIDEFPEH